GWMRRGAERLGNSWRAWRIGPVRVIGFAGYAFLAALVGMLVFGACAGSDLLGAAGVVALSAMVGAALWGQYWVGGAGVLRPFGYFGSVIGAAVGIGIVALVRGLDAGAAWRLSAGIAMCAPWTQAIGRLRCLVNGCCHGRECDARIGIVCRAPMSRIVRLSGLAGRPLHPTPLYSILGNVAIGLFMLHLWRGHSPAHIVGGYLILQSLARFVEEHLRGEPHTPRFAGLRLYQWCAVGTFAAGMAACVLPCAVRTPEAAVGLGVVAWAVGMGLVYGLAMGVDFPESNARFSRLA
ncbi:MAG TPA: prolipoprotein diacylglyceryl transferase family protein, partial [Phycisphaerales bacterium]|nr:prolipoprotein diacylglyceryl transferase family protein [Phycisphaerales bacterium]